MFKGKTKLNKKNLCVSSAESLWAKVPILPNIPKKKKNLIPKLCNENESLFPMQIDTPVTTIKVSGARVFKKTPRKQVNGSRSMDRFSQSALPITVTIVNQ